MKRRQPRNPWLRWHYGLNRGSGAGTLYNPTQFDMIPPVMPTISDITIDPLTLPEPVDLRTLFEREAPLELEIGSHKGTFLVRRAKEHPELNFVGLEWANKYYQYAADRMLRWGLTNVRMMRCDAKHFVIHQVAPACIDALHIYHPDPWPKKRHHKRRMIQPDLMDAALRIMKPGARLSIQTDHAGYFEHMREVILPRPDLQQVDFVDEAYGTVGDDIKTNFEIKYEREGRTFYRFAFRKI